VHLNSSDSYFTFREHKLSKKPSSRLQSTTTQLPDQDLIALPSTKGIHSMTKADLVDKVTALGDLTRRDGEVIVDTLFESVIGALKSGDKIEIRGFGSFRTRQRNARTGRNPKTGAKVDVPAKRVPFFKPSKELRDSVNPSGAVKAKAAASKKADAKPVDPHHPPAM
jgi:integration host factor subunit beta